MSLCCRVIRTNCPHRGSRFASTKSNYAAGILSTKCPKELMSGVNDITGPNVLTMEEALNLTSARACKVLFARIGV